MFRACLKDALGNAGAVERLQLESPENEEIEGTFDEGGDGIGHD